MPLCEFQQPFDGTQPPVPAFEQALVKARFVRMVGSLLLQHIDRVEPWPLSKADSEWVRLRDPKGYRGLSVNVAREEIGKNTIHWIMLQAEDDKSSDYRTDLETNAVVRYDSDPSLSLESSFRTPFHANSESTAMSDFAEMSEEEERGVFTENMQKLDSYLTNEYANQDLEKALGINQLLVGLVEIDHLQKLVMSAKPVRN
jgi:hypothetical protein